MKHLTLEEMQGLAQDALEAAIRHIQDVLGVKTGDVASHVFSDRRVQRELLAYIAIEIGSQNDGRGLGGPGSAPDASEPTPSAPRPDRCAYADCPSGFMLYDARQDPNDAVTCPRCREALCLPVSGEKE